MRSYCAWLFVLCIGMAGCGGGGGGGGGNPGSTPALPPQAPPAPPAGQSAGGIWRGLSGGETLTLLVAETGELRSLQGSGPGGSTPPAFGSGAVVVSGTQVSGAYDARRLVQFALVAAAEEKCEFTGTLAERSSMIVTIDCTDGAGASASSSFTLLYDATYETDSSLAAIAGNYVLGVKPTTNVLNVNADGVIFGSYDNGANCTINGTVALIDPSYNLYRFEWQLSLCQGPFVSYEGATLSGFGHRAPPGPAGAVFVLLTGIVQGRLEFVSLLYEPA